MEHQLNDAMNQIKTHTQTKADIAKEHQQYVFWKSRADESVADRKRLTCENEGFMAQIEELKKVVPDLELRASQVPKLKGC